MRKSTHSKWQQQVIQQQVSGTGSEFPIMKVLCSLGPWSLLFVFLLPFQMLSCLTMNWVLKILLNIFIFNMLIVKTDEKLLQQIKMKFSSLLTQWPVFFGQCVLCHRSASVCFGGRAFRFLSYFVWGGGRVFLCVFFFFAEYYTVNILYIKT